MTARTRIFVCFFLGICVIATIVSVALTEANKGKIETPSEESTHIRKKPRPLKQVYNKSGRTNSDVAEINTQHSTSNRIFSFSLIISAEDFRALLNNIADESIEVRAEAWRNIKKLGTKEKIHWLGIFSRSDDEKTRAAAMKVVRACFGIDAFSRRTKTSYWDMKARREQAAAEGRTEVDNVVPISFEGLPSKREAVQINDIVRTALRDESPDVQNEALLAASSFDVETCKTIYQYAMMSCCDDVRLAVLREAEYGDDDFRLRLQMAALDVGGEEVVKAASDGIEKATGRRFSNSSEAFAWYEKNHIDD